ncbi:MAG: hypothetical protein IJP31_01390 [Lachnospiraceae bacterium]|nr:hypothetical protein [Lachnospiraceae bacterium]
MMKEWLNDKEENRILYDKSPLEDFLSVTGMSKEKLVEMMFPSDDKTKMIKYLEEGTGDFTLPEAQVCYTNGWDIVNVATVDAINQILERVFGKGVVLDIPAMSDIPEIDVNIETTLDSFRITELNGSLADITTILKDCSLSGTYDGTPVNGKVKGVELSFQIMLQELILETEKGTNLELYLSFKEVDTIKNINVKVDLDTDSKIARALLNELMEAIAQKIISGITANQAYKICTVEIDEQTQERLSWIIPEYARFSGSEIMTTDIPPVKIPELAVFAKTLDKNVADLPLDFAKQYADTTADGVLGVAERLTLGYILPEILAKAIEGEKVSARYDEKERCLIVNKEISYSQSGADFTVKDIKIYSREGGFRLRLRLDGNWGGGMVIFDADGYIDIKMEYVKDDNGEYQLIASIGNPEFEYDVNMSWWMKLIIGILCISIIDAFIDLILGIVLAVAIDTINSIFEDISENGVDGLPVSFTVPIEWNNLKLLEIKSMRFSEGISMSYDMKIDQESVEQLKLQHSIARNNLKTQ